MIGRAAAAMGVKLLPGQRFIFDVALELRPDGRSWVFDEVVDTEPRRAGKTFKLSPLVAHRLSISWKKHEIWLTAQDNTRAVDRWLDIASKLDSALNRGQRVVKKRISNTKEILEHLETGSFFRPFAPGEKQMHGADPDLAIADELWAMSLEDKGWIETAIEPAFAVKSGQFWKLSAAGTERSVWLNMERERGRQTVLRGCDEGLAYFEWSIPETVDGVAVNDLDDDELLELILRFHPRGYIDGVSGDTSGLRPGFVASQIGKNRTAAIRSYGNLTQEDCEAGLWSIETWQLAAWPHPERPRIPNGARVALGVAVDELGREASIVIGAKNGPVVLEAPQNLTQPGETWVPAEIVRLCAQHDVAAIGWCNFGRVRSVGDKIVQLLPEMSFVRLNGLDYAAACARLNSEISEATSARPSMIQHGSEPHFTAAMQAAVESHRLKAGPTWTISETRKPIEVLEAATVCAWTVEHMPDPEPGPPEPFEIW